MTANKYQWRIETLAKGVDPDTAMQELERIENIYGELTPENVLKESEKKRSVFHSLFLWDDEQAAHKYRLKQAQTIINNIELIIVNDDEEKYVPAFEIIKTSDSKCYKNVEKFTQSDIDQVRANAVRELNSWKNKLAFYNQFSRATKKIEQAVDLLSK